MEADMNIGGPGTMKYARKLLLGGTSLMMLLSVLSACGSKTETNAASGGDASWQEDRVAALEKKLEEQSGKLEEQNITITDLKKKLDELSASVAAASQGGGSSSAGPGNNGSAGRGDSVVITFAQYEKIEVGMTFDEVIDILGGEGEALSEAENMVVYNYKGVGDTGANAVLAFQGGKLLTKAQSGLE